MLAHRHRSRVLTLAACALLVSSTEPAAAACVAPRNAATTLALILSGGGAKGAWEAGVATALVERQQPLRVVAGSSSGALNAAMIADGRLDRLESVWRTLTRDDVYTLRPSVFFAGLLPGWLTVLGLNATSSIFDPRPLRELIGRSVDLDRVRASGVRVLVVTTDLVHGDKHIFDNATLTIDALMAAAAVPGAFPPVSAGKDVLVDGGVTGRAPVIDALESGISVDRALIVMGFTASRRERPTSMRHTLEAAFEIAMIAQIERDAELARLKYPGVDVQILAPSTPLGLRPQDFDPPRLGRAFDQGKRDGAACADVWRAPAR